VSIGALVIHFPLHRLGGRGLPLPGAAGVSGWLFEVALAFLTGLFFGEAAVFNVAYVLFLAFSFHGPDCWGGNMMEYGFFTAHFGFVAGLLFASVRSPEMLSSRAPV
jgi:uncharacterized membrane protein YphA (DoxX/SURF4 family)